LQTVHHRLGSGVFRNQQSDAAIAAGTTKRDGQNLLDGARATCCELRWLRAKCSFARVGFQSRSEPRQESAFTKTTLVIMINLWLHQFLHIASSPFRKCSASHRQQPD